MLPSASRIRSVVADCKTEIDITLALRSHKIRYSYATDTGYMSIRIPCRKGIVRIYRTCSRSAPFLVRPDSPMYTAPILHKDD